MKDEIHIFLRNSSTDMGANDGFVTMKLSDYGIYFEKERQQQYKIIVEQCNVITTTENLNGEIIVLSTHHDKTISNVNAYRNSEDTLCFVPITYHYTDAIEHTGTDYSTDPLIYTLTHTIVNGTGEISDTTSSTFYLDTDVFVIQIRKSSTVSGDYELDEDAILFMKIILKKV